ncbi:tRNA (adenosine(37)-N6)-threonylcarbamoyltransferase complex ATPase subunit type 1 TsaE [Candidatus Kaiserbacteria bacterium RIFCSPHIGHO2_01_FULL_46_22]|uniref:tRNA threonylcarbamoyladenosine biosynthesis protein TsaE n=1 Tax=Candidatus Kaiserbacteria bacterium RIFCSPHIGHO2_01_FULL_46_22 TaxID=1798475 RepID=A0A1F6BX19_9BACT|nr:MAG: tRNA (adenosine(37)-N6)-threonylcarbamoyltransferase complex ATPase subunit type 1 TsaE [Candidatus Kaiserbacteria bacterium RIFCSPHIGHO2_01_FULL_46_22]
MNERQWDITDKSDLERVTGDILSELAKEQRTSSAVVLGLHGDLGAGKTTFVQMLADQLGVQESVTSPTFVIMKKYQTKDQRFSTLVHIDAYRLESAEELEVLDFSSELSDEKNIICIEWAEKVTDLLPPLTKNYRFVIDADNRRTLILE